MSQSIDIDNYLEKYTQYYELKKKYDDYKKKLLTSHKDKSKSNITYKCINCKQIGGTLFENKKDYFKVICGNTSSPCDLNINITKFKVTNVKDRLSEIQNDIDVLKKKIIILKLDYMFDYITNDESIQKFEKLKIELNNLYDIYNKLLDNLNIITKKNISYLNTLEEKQINLNDYIDKYKKLCDMYKSTRQGVYKKEAILLYINNIMKINNDILNFKYNSIFIDNDNNDNNENIVNFNKYTIDQFEIYSK